MVTLSVSENQYKTVFIPPSSRLKVRITAKLFRRILLPVNQVSGVSLLVLLLCFFAPAWYWIYFNGLFLGIISIGWDVMLISPSRSSHLDSCFFRSFWISGCFLVSIDSGIVSAMICLCSFLHITLPPFSANSWLMPLQFWRHMIFYHVGVLISPPDGLNMLLTGIPMENGLPRKMFAIQVHRKVNRHQI